MHSLVRLSEELADEQIVPADVLASFTQMGFTQGVEGLEIALQIADQLNGRFHSLASILTSIAPITQRFLNGRQLLRSFEAKKKSLLTEMPQIAAYDNSRSHLNGKTDYCHEILHTFKQAPTPLSSNFLDYLAISWVLASIQDWTPEYSSLKPLIRRKVSASLIFQHLQSISLNTADLTPSRLRPANTIFTRIDEIINGESDFGIQSLTKWLAQILTCVSQPPIAESNGINDTIIVAEQNASERTENEANTLISTLTNRPVRQWRNLTERERLVTHHLAMPENELRKLGRTIRTSVENESGRYLDAILSALAIFTCKTVSELLEVSIDPSAVESICIRLHTALKRNYLVWTRQLSHSGPTLSIVLPKFLKIPLKELIQGRTNGTIASCLLPSEQPWENRTYNWLESISEVSRANMQRQLKHALPRELYRSGVNSAVIEWLTRPIDQDSNRFSRDRDALSFYLPHENHSTHKQYAAGVEEIFGRYRDSSDIAIFQANNLPVYYRRQTPHEKLHSFFRARIDEAKASDDFRTYHNWFSKYCLLLLIISTGHRVSRTPFYFSWDLLLDERLAFICDKAVVGSEARFVPLTDLAVSQIKEYFKHLNAAAEMFRGMGRKLPTPISELTNLASDTTANKGGKENALCSNGLFFLLDKQWNATPISTVVLENSYSSEPELKITVRSFRSSLVTSLWEENVRGFDIEALLGHNRNLHIFGEASTWSVQEWANRIRPKIDAYLAISKWQIVPAWRHGVRSSASFSLNHSCPAFAASTSSYEGRNSDNKQAALRARAAIYSIVTPEFLQESGERLADDEIQKIEKELAYQFSGDKAAQGKCRIELKRYFDRMSLISDAKQSASINLIRTELGPVEVTFARHFAIAANIRHIWKSQLGEYAKTQEPAEAAVIRLAQIALSLVIFDAVLNEKQLVSLVLAIAEHKYYRVNGQLIVRAEVELPPYRYDKAVILSPLTAAQVLGFRRCFGKIAVEINDDTKIQREVSRILIRMLGRKPKSKWTVRDVITVFKPWWFVRLPGCLSAIATGKYLGPALDIRSEAAFFRESHERAAEFPFTQREPSDSSLKNTNAASQRKIAKSELNALVSGARQRFEDGKGASKQQRTRLRQQLAGPLSIQLEQLVQERQIVSLLFDFLGYLLEEGGKRKQSLRFGTIATYLSSSLSELVDFGWEVDFMEFEDKDYIEFYRKIKNAVAHKNFNTNTVITLFHRFLEWRIDAPFVPGIDLGNTVPKRVRSTVITADQFDRACSTVQSTKCTRAFEQNFSHQFLALGYGYGARFKEAFGLTTDCFIGHKRQKIYVGVNRLRSVKSKSPRIIDVLNLPTKQKTFLSSQVNNASSAQQNDAPLFTDPSSKGRLYSTQRISELVTSALRNATGNAAVVSHSLRHTYATCLATSVLPDIGQSNISKIIRAKLVRDIDPAHLTSPIDGDLEAWPFWMDRVAMLLGHEGVSTAFNTYWHTPHYNIAAYASLEFNRNDISGKELASVLEVTAAAISLQRKRLGFSGDKVDNTKTCADLISHYICKSGIPTVADIVADLDGPPKKGRPKTAITVDSKSVNNDVAMWQTFDRLLCGRQSNAFSVAESLELASNEFGLSKRTANNFFVAYKVLVDTVGFDDFEPSNSELLTTKPKYSQGVQRGAGERQHVISLAQHLAYESSSFRQSLISLCTAWSARLNSEAPWLVANDVEEAVVFINLLVDLGASRSQIYLNIISYSETEISRLRSLVDESNFTFSAYRVSQGNPRAKISEIGINVRQQANTILSDGRDLHRALAVLAVIIKSGVMNVGAGRI